jgi:purine-binding chemotaxis protein CheW
MRISSVSRQTCGSGRAGALPDPAAYKEVSMSVTSITEAAQYLTFRLSQEVFAVEVAKVREILEYITITRVPKTPEFMRGVINVRGSVVPVLDVRLKFGMSATERTVNTCIVVLEIDFEGETTILGALADSVQEVIELEPDQIEPAPKIGTQLRTEFIKGIGKRDNEFIMILDIDKVFSAEDLEKVTSSGVSLGMEEAV